MDKEFDKEYFDRINMVLDKTAMTTAANSEQLGLVIMKVKDIEAAQRELKEKHNTLVNHFGDYIEKQKQKEYIAPDEYQELDQLLTNRVNDLLRTYGINHNKYFGKFKSQAWRDGKRYSHVVGKGGVYTKHMYFEDVKEYYGSWTPHGYGVQGYVNHLNALEEIKTGKKRAS